MSDKNLSWTLSTAPEIYSVGNTGTRSVVATEMGWTQVVALTGTASSSGTTVTGTSTTFTADLRVGSTIIVGGQVRKVAAIASDTSLTTNTAFSPALSGATLLKFEEVLVALSELLSKKVDVATVPTFTLTLPADGNYVTDDILEFIVTASEAVEVVNTPRIAVTIGANTRYALYSAADSTSTDLVFKYTVVAGDLDSDGIEVADTLNLNTTGKVKDKILASGGTVDVAGASLTYTVGTTTGILVND
jgi:predicted nucleotidyltransferase